MAPDLGDLDIFEERLVIHGAKVGGRRLTKALFMQLEEKFTSEPGSIRAWVNFHWNYCNGDNLRPHRHFIWSDANGRVFRSDAHEPVNSKVWISLDEPLAKGVDCLDLKLGTFSMLHSSGEIERYSNSEKVYGETLFQFQLMSDSNSCVFYFHLDTRWHQMYTSLVELEPRKERMTSEEIRATLEEGHVTSASPFLREQQTAMVEKALAQREKWLDIETVRATLRLQEDAVDDRRAVISGIWNVITTEVPQVFL